jgi:hypothetical protein
LPSHQAEFKSFAESAVNLLSKELQTFREACKIDGIFFRIRLQKPQRTEEEDGANAPEERAYATAVRRLRDSKSSWKQSSLEKIRKRVGDLYTVAAEYPHPNPKKWAKLVANQIIGKVFPVSGALYTSYQDRAINTWLCEQLQEFVDEADIEWFKHTLRAESEESQQPLEPRSAKPTAYQGKSASRPQRRHVDVRKELIASLKARNRNAGARKICELIDRAVSATPSLQHSLAPLESWKRQASGERTWVGFYDHSGTRNLVRTYVNKVPPLETAKSQK